MAISRTVRPSVIVAGVVSRTRELKRKTDNGVYATEVVLSQDSGAQVGVTVYLRENPTPIPSLGEVWACEATVEESREYGASLNYEGSAENALDALYSSTAGAKG